MCVHTDSFDPYRAKPHRTGPRPPNQQNHKTHKNNTKNQACLAVAQEMGVPAVDLFSLLGGNDADLTARAPNLNDGLHLSGRSVVVTWCMCDTDTREMMHPLPPNKPPNPGLTPPTPPKPQPTTNHL